MTIRSIRVAASALLLLSASGGCVTAPDDFDLWPIFRNQRSDGGGEVAVLWPLSKFEWSGDGMSESEWVFPFYAHWSNGDEDGVTLVPMVPPLYTHQERVDYESTSLFPLFSNVRTGARIDRSALVLLGEWSRYDGEEGLVRLNVFPLFQWEERGAGERLSLIRGLEISPTGPLFSLLDIDRTGLSIRPESDEPSLAVDFASVFGRIVNLFHWDDVGSHDDLRFLTLFANEDWSLFQRRAAHEGAPGDDQEKTILFPFYWNVRHAEDSRTRMLWPFYGSTTRGAATIARYFVFPLLWWEDDPERQRSSFHFLWPLIGTKEEEGQSAFWFRPLFSYEGSENGYEWSALLSFFGWGRDGDRSMLRLFWIPWEL